MTTPPDQDANNARLLLIDTCAEAAGVALSLGEGVVVQEDLVPRKASAEMVVAVQRLLERTGWRLSELHAVGVVSGPGSFTGLRTGLAAAKGFCEASGLRLAAVSRLAILAEAGTPMLNARRVKACAAPTMGLAVLDAGRGEFFVREIPASLPTLPAESSIAAREWLCSVEELRGLAADRAIVLAEERLVERLPECELIVRPLTVADALGPLLHRLQQGASDVSTIDANYVRGENDIYKPLAATLQGAASARRSGPA